MTIKRTSGGFPERPISQGSPQTRGAGEGLKDVT